MNTTLLVCNRFMQTHPVTSARLLDKLSVKELAEFLAKAEPKAAAQAFAHVSLEHAAGCLAAMEAKAAHELLGELHPDSQVPVLRLVPEQVRESLISGLPAEQAEPIRRMLKYPEGTVGELMDPFVFTVPEDISVQEALKRARGAKLEMPSYVYVLDRNQALTGVVSIKNLIRARRAEAVTGVMHAELVSLQATSAKAEMVKSIYWREFHTLPVTDEDGLFQGVVRYQTIARLREEMLGDPEKDNLMDTALALGELYWMGLAGIMDGVAGRAGRESAERRRESQE